MTPRSWKGLTGKLAVCAALALWTTLSLAQENTGREGERAAAEVLFEAGRAAMAAGDYDEACAKFADSHALDKAPGTLLNLGNCEEKRGRIASAWERYRGATRLLKASDRRHAFAQSQIEKLNAQVPYLTVELEADAPNGTRLFRNERELSGSLGIPLPLDPGIHEFVARAEGHEPRTLTVELGIGEKKFLRIRPGEKLPEKPTRKIIEPPTQPLPAADPGLSQTTVGYIVGGVGVAGIATAMTMGAIVLGKKSASESCTNKQCPDESALDAANGGSTFATVADVSFLVGAVALGAGVYLVLSDEEPSSTALEAGSFREGYNGVRLRGAF